MHYKLDIKDSFYYDLKRRVTNINKYKFYVVARNIETELFEASTYKTENKVLTERDFLNISRGFADIDGIIRHQIISWQRIE